MTELPAGGPGMPCGRVSLEGAVACSPKHTSSYFLGVSSPCEALRTLGWADRFLPASYKNPLSTQRAHPRDIKASRRGSGGRWSLGGLGAVGGTYPRAEQKSEFFLRVMRLLEMMVKCAFFLPEHKHAFVYLSLPSPHLPFASGLRLGPSPGGTWG